MSSPVGRSNPTVQPRGLLNIAKPPANVAPCSLHSEEGWGAAKRFASSFIISSPFVPCQPVFQAHSQHNRAQTNKKVTPAAPVFFSASAASRRNPSKIFSAAPHCHYYYSYRSDWTDFFACFFLNLWRHWWRCCQSDLFSSHLRSISGLRFKCERRGSGRWGGVICRLETSVSCFSFCGIQIGFTPVGPFVGSTGPAAVAVQRQVRSWCVGPRC